MTCPSISTLRRACRSGKTSIQQVLFSDVPPKQTFFLEPTSRTAKHQYEYVRIPSTSYFLPLLTSIPCTSTVIPLEIWDCPGNITPDSLGASLSEFSSIIFVIDIQVPCLSSFVRHTSRVVIISPIQDAYQQPIARMLEFFIAAYQENPGATLEVFVHKAESLAEDYKIGTWSRDACPYPAAIGITPS